MEAKLHKLKVTELKELLAEHSLPQTGKKDELIKRLVENNISADDSSEELVDPEAEIDRMGVAGTDTETTAPTTTAVPEHTGSSTDQPKPELTPEQIALKARAERFGLPFDPNAKPRTQPTKPATNTTSTPKSRDASVTKTEQPKKEKAGAIDKTSLGLSKEVLAKRAAKFGLPEKKVEQRKESTPTSVPTTKKPETEITPEMAEKIAAEEEKKRKRAEKFGTGKPSNGTSEESDAKKAKVDG